MPHLVLDCKQLSIETAELHGSYRDFCVVEFGLKEDPFNCFSENLPN